MLQQLRKGITRPGEGATLALIRLASPMSHFLRFLETWWFPIGIATSVPISFYEAGRMAKRGEPGVVYLGIVGAGVGSVAGPLLLPAYAAFKAGRWWSKD